MKPRKWIFIVLVGALTAGIAAFYLSSSRRSEDMRYLLANSAAPLHRFEPFSAVSHEKEQRLTEAAESIEAEEIATLFRVLRTKDLLGRQARLRVDKVMRRARRSFGFNIEITDAATRRMRAYSALLVILKVRPDLTDEIVDESVRFLHDRLPQIESRSLAGSAPGGLSERRTVVEVILLLGEIPSRARASMPILEQIARTPDSIEAVTAKNALKKLRR